MGEQKDEESRMYCNISHADMRQGRKRLLMTPRIKGRIVQFCAKHGVSGKTLPDGRTCVALMKHVGFFTADTSVFRHVTSKVLAWIQSNVSQAKMSGVLKEERVGTEGKRQHHWAIQYAVAAGDWMDKDYNPFESGFGQTKDVQFAEPILRQSHSLDAAVNAAVDAAVLDAEGEAYTPSAVLGRKSHHEKDDTVMDEARDLSETALSHPSLPRSPALSTTSPDSFGESPFHQAIAHMMVVANNSTMEQVQAYLNSEQGIKDAIARLFVDDQKTHPELRSEELLQTREHAHALAIENGRMQERIRDLEHKLSILSEVTNHPEYIALDCRLRTTEAELSLARKDAVLEKVKSVDYLNLQQRCEGLDNQLATFRTNSKLEMDNLIARLASAQHKLAARDADETAELLSARRQLAICQKALSLARENSLEQQSVIEDPHHHLAATLQSIPSEAESQNTDGVGQELLPSTPGLTEEMEPKANTQCSVSNGNAQEERATSGTYPYLSSERPLQSPEDHLPLTTTSTAADEEPIVPATGHAFGDLNEAIQQVLGVPNAVSTHDGNENGGKQNILQTNQESGHGCKTEDDMSVNACDKIKSITDGHTLLLPAPDDNAPQLLSTQAPAATTTAAEHPVGQDPTTTLDPSLHSLSSSPCRNLGSTCDASTSIVPPSLRSLRIQRPVRPSWI